MGTRRFHSNVLIVPANAPSGESKPTPTSQAAKPKPADIPQSSAPAVVPQHNPSGPPSSNATPGNPVPVQEYTAPPGQVPTVISHVPTRYENLQFSSILYFVLPI